MAERISNSNEMLASTSFYAESYSDRIAEMIQKTSNLNGQYADLILGVSFCWLPSKNAASIKVFFNSTSPNAVELIEYEEFVDFQRPPNYCLGAFSVSISVLTVFWNLPRNSVIFADFVLPGRFHTSLLGFVTSLQHALNNFKWGLYLEKKAVRDPIVLTKFCNFKHAAL